MSRIVQNPLLRRLALAIEPQPEGVSAPPLAYRLGELVSMLPQPRGRVAVKPARRPAPVLLLPGFIGHPWQMRRLEAALAAAGHHPYGWGLGLNMGATAEHFAFLCQRVAEIHRAEGAAVALVGWSLGGLLAREIAKTMPGQVARVITMGSPFSGDLHANNAWRTYQLVTGRAVTDLPIPAQFSGKPPVPTVALWSAQDGIVAPESARGEAGERDAEERLGCRHFTFASDPEAISAVLRWLDADFLPASPAKDAG